MREQDFNTVRVNISGVPHMAKLINRPGVEVSPETPGSLVLPGGEVFSKAHIFARTRFISDHENFKFEDFRGWSTHTVRSRLPYYSFRVFDFGTPEDPVARCRQIAHVKLASHYSDSYYLNKEGSSTTEAPLTIERTVEGPTAQTSSGLVEILVAYTDRPLTTDEERQLKGLSPDSAALMTKNLMGWREHLRQIEGDGKYLNRASLGLRE